MNNLDPRNYRNSLAGTSVKKGAQKNGLTKPADWFTNPKAPLAVATGRHGLVFRSMEDGKNLIETSGEVIKNIEAVIGNTAA